MKSRRVLRGTTGPHRDGGAWLYADVLVFREDQVSRGTHVAGPQADDLVCGENPELANRDVVHCYYGPLGVATAGET